jgi:hypothetical protein
MKWLPVPSDRPKIHITYPLVLGSVGLTTRVIPILVWFGVGFAGQYVALQLQSLGVASRTATNLAFLTFILGGLAALKLDARLRPQGRISRMRK